MLTDYEKVIIEALLRFLDSERDEEGNREVEFLRVRNYRYAISDVKYSNSKDDLMLVRYDDCSKDGITYTRLIIRVYDWREDYFATAGILAEAMKCFNK